MTKSELEKKYLGKRVAVYDGSVRYRSFGSVGLIDPLGRTLRVDLDTANEKWIWVHPKQVRLLKPKAKPRERVVWVHKYSWEKNEGLYDFFAGPPVPEAAYIKCLLKEIK